MAAQSKFKHLLSPIKLGDLELKNRVILASMTRNRNLVPQQVNVEYYTQRANAGLVLTEGTMVSQQGSQWPNAPGIYTEEQTEAWKKVVDSVHNAGGVIFLQVSLPDCLCLSEFSLLGIYGIDCSYGMLGELHIQVTSYRRQQESLSLDQVPLRRVEELSTIYLENLDTLLQPQS